MVDTNDTNEVNNVNEREITDAVDWVMDSLHTRSFQAASQDTWRAIARAAIVALLPYARNVNTVRTLCRPALQMAAFDALVEWRKSQQTESPATLQLRLQRRILKRLSIDVEVTQQHVWRQQYLVDHDLSFLCHSKALIVEPAIWQALEARYPTILHTVQLLMTLHDDHRLRKQALHDWLTAHDNNQHNFDADLSTLGAVAMP